jgi:hypothetical protein
MRERESFGDSFGFLEINQSKGLPENIYVDIF